MDSNSKPSTTAEGVAAMRHLASKEPDPAIRGPDHMAYRFLGWAYAMLAGPLALLTIWLYGRKLPGMYPWLIARTRHYDRVLEEALAGGIRQVVLLGAGYDTRAWRFAGALRAANATVFEVDHPATQNRKRALLGVEVPEHLHFASVDFEREQVLDRLIDVGFDPRAPCLMIWEGVTMYLDHAAVDAVLRGLFRTSASGSRMAFDFCDAEMIRGEGDAYGGAEVRAFVASKGEPLLWGLEPDEAEAFLAARGLQLRELLRPEDFEKRYLIRSDGTLFGQVTGYSFIAEVQIP